MRKMPPEPGVDQHVQQALHNEDLADTGSLPPDWEVTVRFYAAAHWVRAFIKQKLGQRAISSHEEADRLLEESKVQEKIRRLFKRLRWASEDARYYCVHPDKTRLSQLRKDHQRLRDFFKPKVTQSPP